MPESPEEMRDRLAAGKTLRMVAEERARKFDGGDESRVQALIVKRDWLESEACNWRARAMTAEAENERLREERDSAMRDADLARERADRNHVEAERLRETLIAARDLFTRMEMPSYATACDEALDA